MIETDFDDDSVVNIFDIILDESFSDSEYTGIEDERLYKNVLRSNRRVSKKYVRPIFKEPGSKITQKTEETKADQQNGNIHINWKRAIENLPNIVNSVSNRLQTESPTIIKDDDCFYQRSEYQTRLEYIVGNPIERHKFNSRDNPATLRSRFLQRHNRMYSCADPYVESPVATMGDIDILEAKKLRPMRPTSKADGGQLKSLRKEINKIVSSSLDARDPEGTRRLFNRYNDFDDEEREGYEGCASHGCVGVGTEELQDLINDMREFFGRDNSENTSF